MTISVFIVTKNEEKNIRDCLESVKWADEIIIVDSNSSDKTIDIDNEKLEPTSAFNWSQSESLKSLGWGLLLFQQHGK